MTKAPLSHLSQYDRFHPRMRHEQLAKEEARVGCYLARGVAELVGNPRQKTGLALGLLGQELVHRLGGGQSKGKGIVQVMHAFVN